MGTVIAVPPLKRTDIEAQAIRVLCDVHPKGSSGEEPVDIELIYECYIPQKYNIRTGYDDLSHLPGILGITDAASRSSIIDSSLCFQENGSSKARVFRATAGHESGHCIQHVGFYSRFKSFLKNDASLFRANRAELKPFVDPEWQAWEFSMSILMPKHLVLRYHEKGYSPWDMADAFDVNPKFVQTRLGKLKL